MASNATPAASGTDNKLVLLHMAEALAVEQAISALLVGPLTKTLSHLRQVALRDWARYFHTLKGSQSGAQFKSMMQQLSMDIGRLHLQPQTGIIDAAHKGLDLGVAQTFSEAGRVVHQVHVQPDASVYAYAAGVARAVQEKLELARVLANNAREATLMQSTRPLDVVSHAVHIVEQAVTTVFHEHRNLAAQTVIEDLGVLKMWFAEPDACALCKPLHGTVVPADGTFPAVLTHGSRLIDWVDTNAGLAGPPLHPRCRCALVPYEPN